MDFDKLREQLGPRGDKPRKIVICHPDIYPEIQRMVVHDLGHTDVLVQRNKWIEPETAYVIDREAMDAPVSLRRGPLTDGPLYFGESPAPSEVQDSRRSD